MCRLLEEMMKEAYREAYKEACEEGREKVRKAAALRMLEAGEYTLEKITKVSLLSLDEVKTLQAGQEI